MNNAEIQIQFPRPGQWDEFNMTAIYQDADGYTRTTRYTPEEIPADQAPAMLFTAIEYPSFVLKDSASVAFFRYFTQNSDSL